jgi:type IX secretion system substrate protein
MKKIYSLLLTTLVGGFSFAQVSDTFVGTGALNANGWSTHSGTAGQLMISSGSLTYPGLTSTPSGNKVALVAGNGEDLNKATTNITGTAYYSTVVNVPNTTGLHASGAVGDYSIATGASSGASVTLLQGRLFFRAGTVADTFNVGILNNSGGTVTPTYLVTDYPINTPLFIVVRYDFGTNTASLWVNPALGGAETAPNTTNNTGTSAAPAQIGSICLRQAGSAATGTGNIEYDDIRLGTTWAYVTNSVLSIKENNISGLRVYPNPVVNGKLFISSDLNTEKAITIYDVVGKQVLSTTTSNEVVNVSNLNAGVYIVKITEEGKTATRKLVIK